MPAHSLTYLPLDGGSIACHCWGEGPVPIFALHGYAEDGETFGAWGDALPDGCRLYAPDLPDHGKTRWEGAFEVADLERILTGLCGPGTPVILCGYSMGGRLALTFFQSRPTLVRRLVLLAPDGLKENFWYWLATQSAPGNRLFHGTMEHPDWFLNIVTALGRWRLVNMGIVKYVSRYLGDKPNRLHLYRVWTRFRHFRPNLSAIKTTCRSRATPVRLLFGHYDRIIQPSQGKRFLLGAGDNVRLTELPCGHQLLAVDQRDRCLMALAD